MYNASDVLLDGGGRKLVVPVIAATLSIPVVMFSLMGYDINPAFLLAPVIALAFFIRFNKVSAVFALSAALGGVSVIVANTFSPDGQLTRHLLSLLLVMFAPGFLFLGRFLAGREGVDRIIFWLSVFSTIFVVVIAARIFILGEAVRIYLGPLGYSAMNAEFLGVPVFASFGVLSLAHLICLQAIIMCGSIISTRSNVYVRCCFVVGLVCSSFLIIGSDSRSAQVLLVWILVTAILYAIRNPSSWKLVGLVVASILLSGVITYARGMNENRMLDSIEAITSEPVETHVVVAGVSSEVVAEQQTATHRGGHASDDTVQRLTRKADAFATGRIELAVEGFKEVLKSPFAGNGFSGYGRYSVGDHSRSLAENTSTHIYYLTLLWKGGLIFFAPFIAMLVINFKEAWSARPRTDGSPEYFFAWGAVFMAFGPMALAWDILIVPSAGALAFFLFGMLSGYKNFVEVHAAKL
ncbi:O-antigen ligase family protein [Pseudomonas fluorescens]|uniref:O-antigen ligase family protein n=1 Tax=Pseudomonas fluorescens TaxID=294 RepID=UPI003D02E6C6